VHEILYTTRVNDNRTRW